MFARLFLKGICGVAGILAPCRAPAVESDAEMNGTRLAFQ